MTDEKNLGEAGAVADVVAIVEPRAMRMEWSTDAGPVVFRFPSNLSARDVEDVSELLALTVAAMQRRAAHLSSQGATVSDREPVEREGVR
jgi:hypothetical protein